MSEATLYDGTGKLAEAIASLYGLSPKSQARIAELIKQAKNGLGITCKFKQMPDDMKLAIWRWHYDRLHSAQSSVEIISRPDDNEPVEIIAQPQSIDDVNIISQSGDDEPDALNNLDVIRIAFYVSKNGKRVRQVIALDGFYINGLIAATGIQKQDVPKWVQAAVDSWDAFDSELPITRQVKYLIVSAMTEAIQAKS